MKDISASKEEFTANKSKSKLAKHLIKFRYVYGYVLFVLFGEVLINCGVGPEWVFRLLIQYLVVGFGVAWTIWLGLFSPASKLVNPALLDSDMWIFRIFWEGFARLLFTGMAIVLIWGNLIPWSMGIVSLVRGGEKVLTTRQCTVEKVDDLGPTGFIYQIVYVAGQEKAFDYWFGGFLYEGYTYRFLLLGNVGSILKVD